MKKYLNLFFIVLFSIGYGQNNNISATKINQITFEADKFLGYNQFGDFYSIKKNVFSITKEKISAEYKNIVLGEITHIDRQNPLKIVVFYENFNTIILLDNQLNELHKINLSENKIPIVAKAVGLASQNCLWIYNSLTQQIGLYDYLKSSFQSITPPFKGNLKYYESDFNTFQWIDDELNWYSCNIFGRIIKLGKVAIFDHIQFISNNSVLFSKDGEFYLEDIEKNKIYKIENVEKSLNNFYYKDQILSIFTNQVIYNYKIKIP